MNISVTIPQLFYDLIARVLPGFFFLLILKIELLGTGYNFSSIAPIEGNSSVQSLLNGIGYGITCYFLGWILRAFTFKSSEKRTREKIEEKLRQKNKKSSLYDMYHFVRLQNEGAGFRIVKLRAEARMLEVGRTVSIIMFLISLFLLLATKISLINIMDISAMGWIGKATLPIALIISFLNSERPAWGRYYDNVVRNYELIVKSGAKEVIEKNQAASGS